MIGVITLFFKEEDIIEKILLVLVALSAGGLLGGAFFHLLPEAISELASTSLSTINLFTNLIFGFCTFFFLEQFIEWYHEHYNIHQKKPVSFLVLISDLIHNFIDGLVISSSFMFSSQLGVSTTLAVALHEIPQEIGDFRIMVYGGFEKVKALIWNFLSAITVVLGGLFGFFLYTLVIDIAVPLLAFTAGNFIYIAASDLIPEIKHEKEFQRNILNFSTFLMGIFIMYVLKHI